MQAWERERGERGREEGREETKTRVHHHHHSSALIKVLSNFIICAQATKITVGQRDLDQTFLHIDENFPKKY